MVKDNMRNQVLKETSVLSAEPQALIKQTDTLKTALQQSYVSEQSEETVVTADECVVTDIQKQVSRENQQLNNVILGDKLMPEMIQNEKQKRVLKVILLSSVFFFILVQIVVMSVFIGQVVYSMTLGINKYNINATLSIELMTFMKFYIAVTLCEFIAMLFFIVRYVFDKSIFELIKLFKPVDSAGSTYTEHKEPDINGTTNNDV